MIKKKIKIPSLRLTFLLLFLLPHSVLGPSLGHAETQYPLTFLDDLKRETHAHRSPKTTHLYRPSEH